VLYAKHGSKAMSDYIEDGIFDQNDPTKSFLNAPICYALKDARHMRKVLGLDPIANYFLYGFVHKHAKSHFQEDRPADKRRFGYAFKNRKPLSPSEQYHAFRRDTYRLRIEYPYFARVDIGNCFNSFYHHDVQQFVEANFSDGAGANIGQFLREINSGTSVNCFPQGTYPAKAIGNLFLSFIEENARFTSPGIIRFLDDICFLPDENRPFTTTSTGFKKSSVCTIYHSMLKRLKSVVSEITRSLKWWMR